VEGVLVRALAKRPGERFGSGVALCAALAEAAGLPFTAEFKATDDGSTVPVGDEQGDDDYYRSHRPSRTRSRWHLNVALLMIAAVLLVSVLLLAR
jgi:hypothetical protein